MTAGIMKGFAGGISLGDFWWTLVFQVRGFTEVEGVIKATDTACGILYERLSADIVQGD
jgi:hypothetical protein